MFQRSLMVRVVALLTGLLLALTAWFPAAADSPEPVKLRLEVKDGGFNDERDLGIEVQQGHMVELTVAFAQTRAPGDNHIFSLEGYGLETPEVNQKNKEATLKFFADKTGTFELKCDLDCEIHSKLQGSLKVKPAAGGSGGTMATAAALAPTTLALSSSASEVTGGSVKLAASLKDNSGAPVAKAMVRFYVEGELAGTKGQMEIGAAKTDASGTAAVTYKPTAAGAQRITARFEGMGLYNESQESFQLQVRSAQPAYTLAPRGLDPLSDRAPYGLVLVLLSIWSTFGFVLYQVFRIARPRPVREVRIGRERVLASGVPAPEGR